MNVAETLLVFALIPLAVYGVIAPLTLWPKFARTPRYSPGQDWDYEPVWWTANPAGVGVRVNHSAPAESAAQPVRTARGGARGSW